MGMGFAKLALWEWEWKWLDENGREWKLYISYLQPTDHQNTLNGPLFLRSNLSWLLGFTPNVHETLRALTLHVYFWRFGDFFLLITVLFHALLSLPVIYYLIEILLVVREWEQKGMGITDGNGEGMGIELD